MTFDEWKAHQVDVGGIVYAVRVKDSRFAPYSSHHGFVRKYKDKIKHAGERGISCNLTVNEYLLLAYEAKIMCVSEIGRHINCMVLGRVGDVGDYEYGTCRFITSKQNRQESIDNGCAAKGIVTYKALGLVGKNSNKFKGLWHTPKGTFGSTYDASKSIGLGVTTIHRRCISSHKVLQNKSKFFGSECVGKTYKELGWWFEPKGVK